MRNTLLWVASAEKILQISSHIAVLIGVCFMYTYLNFMIAFAWSSILETGPVFWVLMAGAIPLLTIGFAIKVAQDYKAVDRYWVGVFCAWVVSVPIVLHYVLGYL